MGHFYDSLDDPELVKWVLDQYIFWVATAPLSSQGHVNVSPKGRPTFNLAGKNACWYTDMTGSGNETLSHLYEKGNGRITIMFSAFEGPPRIVRLFGKGTVYERGSPEFAKLLPDGDERILPGTRAIIWVDFHKVGTSCGYSVPFFDYSGERLVLDNHFTKLQAGSEVRPNGLPQKLIDYWNLKNSFSIDSMPGLKNADDTSGALVPPFKLEDGAPADADNDGDSAKKAVQRISSQSQITLSLPTLLALLLAVFMLGTAVASTFLSSRTLASQRTTPFFS